VALLDGISTYHLITVWGESSLSLRHFWAFAAGGLRGVFCMACGRQRPTGYRRLKPAVPIRIGRLYPREGLPTQMTSCCGSRSPPALLKASMVKRSRSVLRSWASSSGCQSTRGGCVSLSIGSPQCILSCALDDPGLARHLWRAFSILRCPPFELKRADEVERRMAADGIVQVLTRRHTVRKLATRSRSSILGIPGWDALFAFMR
jgi:hypothetical protein